MRCWHLCAICNIFGLQFHLTSLIIIFYSWMLRSGLCAQVRTKVMVFSSPTVVVFISQYILFTGPIFPSTKTLRPLHEPVGFLCHCHFPSICRNVNIHLNTVDTIPELVNRSRQTACTTDGHILTRVKKQACSRVAFP